MIVFDTLSQLESYEGVFPEIRTIIDVMDRSLPYEEGDGKHKTPEESNVSYIIDTFLTSSKGFESDLEDCSVMEIVLEGDEIVAIDGSVFRMQPGRFLLYSASRSVKRGLSYSLPEHTKAVRFIFCLSRS